MKHLLVGNPNVGKTTFFNSLTGSNAKVGNYSGITVDKLEGTIKNSGDTLIDLPGTYSVTPSSEDEGVVTYALLKEHFDQIINIVDVTHLKRNLQLSIQLLETGYPVTIVMNMMDVLTKKGFKLNVDKIQNMLGVKVQTATARSSEGVQEIAKTLQMTSPGETFKLNYGEEIESAINEVISLLGTVESNVLKRWIAIQLLEGNTGIYQHLNVSNESAIQAVIEKTEEIIVKKEIGFSLKGAIFNVRREFIYEVHRDCLEADPSVQLESKSLSKVDRYLTHPILGAIIFLAIMFFIYMVTFDWLGNPISDFIDGSIGDYLVPAVESLLTSLGLTEGSFIYHGIIDGMIAGVGAVIIFLPQILILFFSLSLLEATGYMARVAIVMDYIFSRFGLDGKAIVPLITGFGCNVPAIMATRTIPNRMERYKMMTIIPFMSCTARLPVYVLFVSAFFDKYQAFILMGLYLLGIIVALLSAKLLSVSIFKKGENQFVLEVPEYRMPQFKVIMQQTADRGKAFLFTAGKFILIGSLLIWFLESTGPTGFGVEGQDSYLA
ncbi:MAG: ferrous iron transport protein B, partial [Turicibacter sp.]